MKARAVPFLAGGVLLCTLAGCVRSAPDLPAIAAAPVTKASIAEKERLAKCGALADALNGNKAEAVGLDSEIKSNRGQNQTLGYLAAAAWPLTPLLLATEGDYKEKDRLDALQAERDRIYAEQRQYRCPSSPD